MLNIDLQIDMETKQLVKEFLDKQEEMYENEHKFLETDEELEIILLEDKQNIPIVLFMLGFDIRLRIGLIRNLAYAENTNDSYIYNDAKEKYMSYMSTQRYKLKSQIQKYFKLQKIYDFRG